MDRDVAIDAMVPADWEAVRRIYAEGIASGHATFETEVPAWSHWDAYYRGDGRLVAREGGMVVGWAALVSVSRRPVYAGVAEVSVYVAERARGRGVGVALLGALVAESERLGVWTLQAAVFPENEASLAAHETCGFRIVGRRERLGRMRGGAWRDVVLLERRSDVVGTRDDTG